MSKDAQAATKQEFCDIRCDTIFELSTAVEANDIPLKCPNCDGVFDANVRWKMSEYLAYGVRPLIMVTSESP